MSFDFSSAHMNYWFWFGLSAILIIVELLLGTSFFLLWIGCVAAVVGIIVWLLPHLFDHFILLETYQVLLFAVGSTLSIVLWKKYARKHPTKTENPTLNRRSEQYVGKLFVLHTAIINGHGKIRVDDSIWRVIGPDLPEGTRVKVISADGVTLKVSPITEALHK